MYILNANITINKLIGEISEEKMNKIKEEMKLTFPETVSVGPNELVFRNGNAAILISSNQNRLAYIFNGEETAFDTTEGIKKLELVLDLLGLKNNGVVGMNIEYTKPVEFNSMDESIKVFKDYTVSSDVAGVAVRYLMNDGEYNGEIKVEPFIQDNKSLFSVINFQSIEEKEINSIELNETYKKYKNILNDSIAKIFSI